MHFQDAYNYDIERVKRCVIHYATPDGKLYPFCTYNSGPCYREKIERQFSIPWDPKTPAADYDSSDHRRATDATLRDLEQPLFGICLITRSPVTSSP